MTVTSVTGASSACYQWSAIQWRIIEKQVHRLQMRIAKAAREGRYGKAKALQQLLTHSYAAKVLATKRVTSNSGGKTAGVDGVVWKTKSEKMRGAIGLKARGYSPQPLRRINIPKKSDPTKTRPLGIPTIRDRAMQALYLLALEPIAETQADQHSYGFRQKRSCADAIEQCFIVLSRQASAQWILEGDIKACFDTISHPWLENNIPMNRKILTRWLNAGYIEKDMFYSTTKGTPQGGIISPTLANMTLDGMETLVKGLTKQADKVNFVRYADDFIITGSTREVLQEKVKPALEAFLKERGLELSQEKTRITKIDDGFDFLGFNVRKYNGKLLIKPAKKSVLSFIRVIRKLIKENQTVKTEELIRQLNARLLGWSLYYRHAVSKQIFSYVDCSIFKAIVRWIKRRHPHKSTKWWRKNYFRQQDFRNWIFYAKIKSSEGVKETLDLFYASYVKVKRHIKIKAQATPFDPVYKDYFEMRAKRNQVKPKMGSNKTVRLLSENQHIPKSNAGPNLFGLKNT